MMAYSGKEYYGEIHLDRESAHTATFALLEEHRAAHVTGTPRVLEVGCNTGYFTEALHTHGYSVHGVEFFCDDAAKRGFTDAFYHGTVEDFLAEEAGKLRKRFDAVILGDVIEHLLDPEAVLRGLARCLKPGGAFLVSVPNVAHVAVRRMLADGEWRYTKNGILDETHLHFFTRASLRALLVKVGFGVERAVSMLAHPYSIYAPLLLDIKDEPELNEREHALQIVVRATRRALDDSAFTTPPRNVFLLAWPPAPSHRFLLRLQEPLRAYCDSVGGELRVGPSCSGKDLRWPDVIVLNGLPSSKMLRTVREARSLGISVVYDMDELRMEPPPVFSGALGRHARSVASWLVSGADAVTCSTPRLQEYVARNTDKTVLVPNCVTPPGPVDARERQREGPCAFVLASSGGAESLRLRGPLLAMLAKYPGSSLSVVGKTSEFWRNAAFPAAFYPPLAPGAFSEFLLSLDNPVGIIFLDGSEASSFKSPVKFHHYTLCGAVAVCSNAPPYSDAIRDGETGLLARDTEEAWHEALDALASDAGKRRRMLEAALTRGGAVSPEENIRAWKRAFHGLPRPDEHLRGKQ